MTLRIDDFDEFFRDVHGYAPFPWQTKLARFVVEERRWPSVLDLPTGSGKTAAIDIAVFHLAMEAERGDQRRAPVRIAFVVDRRLVVDDAHTRAKKLSEAIGKAPRGSVMAAVAERLRRLSGEGTPLLARALRGGIPREDDWARTPSQPTVLCSTVDQIGSRVLFRGYGISNSMKPLHAGLIGSDCLILLDEAHLAEPFRQTLGWISLYRGESWRDITRSHVAPAMVSTLTATPGVPEEEPFGLTGDDYEHTVLRKRLLASKPARLLSTQSSRDAGTETREAGDADEHRGLDAFVVEVREAMATLAARGVAHPAIGIVVNRVGRARTVFERLTVALPEHREGLTLLIGPARPIDRERMAGVLEPLRTRVHRDDEPRVLHRTVIVVATQCIEAGVDIDFDAMITEAAPLDALRQRFGRLNRAGRPIEAVGAIIGLRSVLQSRKPDPVYGVSIRAAWDYLVTHATTSGRKQVPALDFGIESLRTLLANSPPPEVASTQKQDAPVLLPAHVDLLSQTSPVPLADPEVALYLHGPNRQPDSVSVIWRGDLRHLPELDEQRENERVRRLLLISTPRSAEAVQLPLWAVRRWLNGQSREAAALADVAADDPQTDARVSPERARRAFRWRGDDDGSKWILPSGIRPGDTIVVPARYGGLDDFGWNPASPGERDGEILIRDVADDAARPYAERRFVVRVAPGLVRDGSSGALADALAESPDGWEAKRDALQTLSLPADIQQRLKALDNARRRSSSGRGIRRHHVVAYDDLYGEDEGRPRGIVFVAPFGLRDAAAALGPLSDDAFGATEGPGPSTEDDAAGSLPGFPLPLDQHTRDVAEKAEEFASRAGLPAGRIADLRLAATLHDLGKADSRFQSWMHSSDPLGGPDPGEPNHLLAKSDRRLSLGARSRVGLPERWRHEALSVRVAAAASVLTHASDPELVLWLIGTHHGYGRPFFPHNDPADRAVRTFPRLLDLPDHLEPGEGPQSLAFDWRGMDWAALGTQLRARYGAWELARMEAILRLADHRASEEEAEEPGDGRSGR